MGGAGFVRARLAGAGAADAMVMGVEDVEPVKLSVTYEEATRGRLSSCMLVAVMSDAKVRVITELRGREADLYWRAIQKPAAENEHRTESRSDLERLREALQDLNRHVREIENYEGGDEFFIGCDEMRRTIESRRRSDLALAATAPATNEDKSHG